MPWHAELADEQHVQRGVERRGDPSRDRYPSAWQREHDHVVTAAVPGQLRRQGVTGFGAIGIGAAGVPHVADGSALPAAPHQGSYEV
jgi:hypothetical protein